jgi:hypothetical protein
LVYRTSGELLKLLCGGSVDQRQVHGKKATVVRAETLHVRRPGQLGPVKAKFLADAAYNARVEGLARSAERNFRLPPFVMDYDHDWAFPSLLVPVVEATSAVRQPLSKCCALHD